MELVEGITCIYGPAATGKTNLCMLTAAHSKGKTIFIDTENTFSAERIREFNKDANLDKICLISADSFSKQSKVIKELEVLKKVDLIIIDSMTKYYREVLQDDKDATKSLLEQFHTLRNIYKRLGCKVLITSQVYTNQDGKDIVMGGKPIRDFSKQLIRLSHEKERVFEVEKHPEQGSFKKNFRIKADDISFF